MDEGSEWSKSHEADRSKGRSKCDNYNEIGPDCAELQLYLADSGSITAEVHSSSADIGANLSRCGPIWVEVHPRPNSGKVWPSPGQGRRRAESLAKPTNSTQIWVGSGHLAQNSAGVVQHRLGTDQIRHMCWPGFGEFGRDFGLILATPGGRPTFSLERLLSNTSQASSEATSVLVGPG